MALFVLLHDAFQGGWVWRQTARELRDLGHEVHTPSFAGRTLPSDPEGAGSPARTALDNLVRYFAAEDLRNAVLVCTGWSGLLGPALAQALPSAVRTLVFWDAVSPEPGKSFMEVCPEDMADAIDGNSESTEVAPFVSGPLRWLECGEDTASLLTPFPRRAFTEPYAGPARADWPESLFIHSPETDAPGSPFAREAVEGTGMAWLELAMDEYPLLARAQELARQLAGRTAPDASRKSTGCGRNTMPHAMRMQYCPHYRRRHALAAACEAMEA